MLSVPPSALIGVKDSSRELLGFDSLVVEDRLSSSGPHRSRVMFGARVGLQCIDAA